MNAADHYVAVLADLEAQRSRIDIAISSIKALQPATSGNPLHIIGIDTDEDAPPPRPVLVKPVPPADPLERATMVNRLLDLGFSQNEAAENTGIPVDEVARIFRGEVV